MVVIGVDKSGSGETKFSGPPITISGGGGTIEPVYIENITKDLTGNTSTITDQCGYTEVRRSGTSGNWSVDVEGVIGNIQLPDLDRLAATDETVNVQTPLLGDKGGEFVVEKCSVSHTDELNRIDMPNGTDINHAFTFKMTLQSPKAAKQSSS